MPRRKRDRKIIAPPSIKGLAVFGTHRRKSEKIMLHFEEYEAIKFLDYENLTQEEAAVNMEVSRPTLTRIYETARNKVARSMDAIMVFRISSALGCSAWAVPAAIHMAFKRHKALNRQNSVFDFM